METPQEDLNTEVPVIFSGGIIKTLTEELPDNAAAFRELIKNAYDASADVIRIKLDSKRRILTITDDGDGMDRNGIENLFHVGGSEKKYGQAFRSTRSKEVRYYQGSKGIGFLSAMHFGNKVTWTSTREGGKTWEIQCEQKYLEKQKDMKEARLPIKESSPHPRGTSIKIELDDYHARTIKECFNEPKQLSKICNVFRKSSLEIKVNMDDVDLEYEKANDFILKNQNNIFYVKIISKDSKVVIYNGSNEVDSFQIKDNPCYKVDGEISILDLRKGSVEETSKLFVNDNESLTPLIYINDNLLEEYRLFDPEIMRKHSSKTSLPQMIGYIDISCCDEELRFTPDRSRLVRNALSDEIRDALKEINENIQKKAAAYKQKHKKDGTLVVGFTPDSDNIKAAFIQSCRKKNYIIPSPQISLWDLILYARDSKGKSIANQDIKITVDGMSLKSNVIASQTQPGVKHVRFEYDDPETGKAIEDCSLVFNDPPMVAPSQPQIALCCFNNMGNPNGLLMQICMRLQNEINELYSEHNDKYIEPIACSLRSVFELATTALFKNADAPQEMQNISDTSAMIDALSNYLSDNRKRQILSEKCNAGFYNLKNISTDFMKERYENSHLGAHKSGLYVDMGEIRDIAKKASLYAYLLNALISK